MEKQSFWSRLFGAKSSPPSVTADFDTSSVWRPLGGPGSDYSQIYRRQPAVRGVVEFLSRNIGSFNPKVYERVGDDDRRERDDHPLARQLRNPNPAATRYRHLRDTVADIAIQDRAFWWKQRAGSGEVVAVVRVPASKIDVQTDQRTGETVYRRMPAGTVIPRDDLVIFPGYSPDGDDLGVSPMETLRRVLAEEYAAVNNRENMWVNASRQQLVIERPLEAPDWDKPARDRFRSDWNAALTGAHNSGSTAILEEGMTASPLAAFSPEQMEYIEGRHLTYREVALAYGGAPLAALVVGEGSDVKANAENFHKQLYQDVFGPWLRFLQDEIELQLLPEYDLAPSPTRRIYVEFNLAEKLKGSFEEQASTLATSVGVPYMTINDARSRLNMARIDNELFDTPVMPMNVIYGGQPSTQEPVADPSTPPGLLNRSKAVPRGARNRHRDAAKAHRLTMQRFFERQERTIASAVGGKADVWDTERWDEELTDELAVLARRVARESGLAAARQIGGVYDELRTVAWLEERSRIAAEGINAVTAEAVAEAVAGDEPAEAVSHVFDIAKTSRAEEIGLGMATTLIGFAREEAARHSQDADGTQRNKTWVVTSAKSRHPEMDGETVPVGTEFSNGAAWPGDPLLGAAETSGCRCLLIIE